MKKILFYTICCAALSMMACSNDMEVTKPTEVGKITLSLDASGAAFGTRGDVADNEAERKLEWIDIFVFAAGGDNSIATDDDLVYHERIDHSSAMEPHTLGLDINSLTKDQAYYVDVIANSKTLNEINNISANITTRGALFSKIETTEYVQLTGLTHLNNVPTLFLMDGVAYTTETEPASPAAVVLRPTGASLSKNVDLKVTLRRATAKVVFNFKLKDSGEAYFKSFGTTDGTSSTYTPTGSYFIDNMKYKAMLTAEAEALKSWNEGDEYLRTTTEIPYGDFLTAGAPTNGEYKTMTLTTYVYCHKWDYTQNSNASLTEIEPTVIVNLPTVDKDGNNHDRNYYEVSLDVAPEVEGNIDHFALERNHYYVINATINALGGSNPQIRVELEDVKYQVYPWDETTINVGGDNGARYLTLNTEHIEMHNENVDDYSLTFASSSPITSITRTEAYYYNKYGNRINLTSGDDTDRAVVGSIKAEDASEGNLTGGITVTSPMQITQSGNQVDAHKNTIRYLTFEVENEQGLTKTFTVMQYPLIYITNQQGWYSYRSDFKNNSATPTTYEYQGDNILNIGYANGRYSYNSNSPFWRSKYATQITSGYSNVGMSTIYYYRWRSNRVESNGTMASADNGRMYHVRVTATSDEYTLGVPRITNGITDNGVDNERLVSPSFMIASRLGVITVGNIDYSNSEDTTPPINDNLNTEMYNVFGNHCANYVETYQRVENGVTKTIHLDDWRLPTKAELEIITKIQGQGSSNESIDYLLNACYYYSASGPVYNNKNNAGSWNGVRGDDGRYASNTSVRCVRDAFDSNTPPVISNTYMVETE